MKEIDFLSLDGRSLRTFLTVLEELSVTGAAARLGVTQSAVSHILDKLRLVLGDPLFVRSGRGIVPTDRAIALREPVRAVLDKLKELTNERVFDPLIGTLEFTIAANDFQRDLIFPRLLRELHMEGVDARFRFIPSGLPATDLLRRAHCQLIVTPFPPEGPDIYQSRLFDDHYVCFYDANVRSAPSTLEAFMAADFIEVLFDDNESALSTLFPAEPLKLKKPRISVPNFAAVAAFLKGSNMIATETSLMGKVNLQGFNSSPVPFKSKPLTMYMAWHKRDHADPAHRWLRSRITNTASGNVT